MAVIWLGSGSGNHKDDISILLQIFDFTHLDSMSHLRIMWQIKHMIQKACSAHSSMLFHLTVPYNICTAW